MHRLITAIRAAYRAMRRTVFPPRGSMAVFEQMDPVTLHDTLTDAPPPSDRSMTALFAYRDENVRRAIWHLKYHGNRQIASQFSKHLAERIEADLTQNTPLSDTRVIVVPITLSPERQRARGWSQSDLLAQETYKTMTVPSVQLDRHILTRRGQRTAQTDLSSRTQRLRNMDGAFGISKRASIDPAAHYIVIDDVTTTGATLRDARRALTDAGARTVWCYAVAH